MQNSKSARDTIATIQIKTPRKCANTQNTNVIKQNSTNARKINYGKRTEWSPIRSIIIQVIDKIGRLRTGSPICQSLV